MVLLLLDIYHKVYITNAGYPGKIQAGQHRIIICISNIDKNAHGSNGPGRKRLEYSTSI